MQQFNPCRDELDEGWASGDLEACLQRCEGYKNTIEEHHVYTHARSCLHSCIMFTHVYTAARACPANTSTRVSTLQEVQEDLSAAQQMLQVYAGSSRASTSAPNTPAGSSLAPATPAGSSLAPGTPATSVKAESVAGET